MRRSRMPALGEATMDKVKVYLLLVLIGGCISLSCQTKNNELLDYSSVELDNSALVNFENCASEVAFIPLVAPKDSLINLSCRVFELVVTDKIYYANKCVNDLSIHSFDLAGNHLKSWNRKGDGPGEYPSLHGMIVEKDDLYINTGRGTLLKYQLPQFDLKQEITLGDYGFVPTVSLLSPENFLIASEPVRNVGNQVFHAVNVETKTSKTLPIATLPYSGELNPGMITKMQNGHLLSFGLSDTIYQFIDDSVSTFIHLNFGEKGMLPADFELSGEAFMENVLLSQNYAFNTGQIDFTEGVTKVLVYGIERSPNFSSEDLITFPFFEVFIHRDTGKKKITKSLLGFRNQSYSKDGYFYQVMQPSDWQRALDIGYFGSHENKLLETVEQLTDREDPIIVTYKVVF
ncbi:6-bladed beta-propeller protein [Cyclobacterium xiamenense]|uniref:6-bladed beta-propeller protein n=1 Tax=Cyclobacterium xiamenense TaxID=1297121 RepID=A0A1H6TCC2_9BACT|nr:6-bladed beta-propeller [Cyclobacterium xiamenense]SEI77743.1 6-bladed beta-propeller protein [Cyclobacterium xiamenense]